MARPEAAPGRSDRPTALFDGAFRLVAVLAALLLVLVGVRIVAGGSGSSHHLSAVVATASEAASGGPTGSEPAIDVAPFLTDARPAADLDLTGPDGRPMSLASMRGAPVLVFFGFTHCADVCPATIGTVGLAIDAYGHDAKAIFVTVDPERDTVPWLAEFVRYMPAGFTAVTGTPIRIRTTADAWGVRYAKVVEDDPVNYEMSHTADVFLVDAAGQLRALFPFGTDDVTMTAVMRSVAATDAPSSPAPAAPTTAPPATPAPTPVAAAPAVMDPATVDIWPRVVSSSVWAGGSSPVILALYDRGGTRIDDPALHVTVQRLDGAGARTGPVVDATTIQPIGVDEVSFVPTLDLPASGHVRLAVDVTGPDGARHLGIVEVEALDPGGTAALGAQAPTVRTPTAADFGGDLGWISTDPLPDPRLYETSTRDALAAHTPFVLVVDSYQFKVTPVCGRAVVMAKALLDRWTSIPFIHLEPYRYSVVTSEPVLEGSLADPRLTDVADAWGVGAAPWGVKSMPWVFLVDGTGTIRAKYQGVIGTADLDVILTLLAQEH